ncbi:hypothetical protein ACFWP2_29775 [Kitasatospora sp. NPDC058444]|uniref:hypothetical protein n=1 Tax=Kitasatospora sp. NPDC058444 TaxID=3346504 RepID=UPI00364DC6B7
MISMPIDMPGHHIAPMAERFRRPSGTSPSRGCASSRCAPPPTAGPRTPSAAARLCADCVDLLRANLRRLLDAYRESDHALTPTTPRSGVRVGGTKTAKGIVLDQRAMDLRSRMTETLASWARLVVDETRSPGPRHHGVVSLVDFLRQNIEWLAAHPAAADFDEEVRQLLESCRTVLGPTLERRTPIGVCPEADCHSTLHVIRQADAAARHSSIACDSGHVLPPQEWLRYAGGRGSAMTRNDMAPLTVAEVRS